MPDPNNPLETALRQIREIVPNLDEKQMVIIRATLINYRNLETASLDAEADKFHDELVVVCNKLLAAEAEIDELRGELFNLRLG